MAENANPAHEHELSARGSAFQHDSGWGALYLADGGYVRVRSTRPCFDDPGFDELASVETDFAIVHARRAKNPRTIATANTHPFLARWLGAEWGYCHNGEVRDLAQLSWDPTLALGGSTDSERLFLHILTAIGSAGVSAGAPVGSARVSAGAATRSACASAGADGRAPGPPDGLAEVVARTLAGVRDFTCLNSFLAVGDTVLVATRRAADSEIPRYYTMWRAAASDRFRAVSSEPVDALGCAWEPVENGSALVLARPGGGPPAR